MTGSYGIYLNTNRRVEAFLYDGDIKDRNGVFYVPKWMVRAYQEKIFYFSCFKRGKKPSEAYIRYMGGSLLVKPGDYIVKDEAGDIYPVRRERFEVLYTWMEAGK